MKEKKIKIIFKNPSPIIIKKVNKEHFQICFSNILSNAIKYSPESSKIFINIGINNIEIRDYGKGIDKKNQKKIFERYFRESYIKNGQGVGLSLVKKICDTNKWKIKIKSRKNYGTKVVLILI